MTYKIGDKVKLIVSDYNHDGKGSGPVCGSILEVKENCDTRGLWIDKNSVQLKNLNHYYSKDFELVEEEKVKNKFAVGDKVISVFDTSELPEGFIGYILSDVKGLDFDYIVHDKTSDIFGYFNEDDLELLTASTSPDIARPVLEERKIGKVKMELFDAGFPNAILEIAKVMTWAADNKGYKPHDWVNLPDAESSFPAAASRHRVKGLIQKVSGVAVSDRVDEESAILHKAHEAFNVIAELELILRGSIK